ncbi:interferon regulatory factor 9 [Rhinolophus ferrumequinum]|uniref:Interferon regulatory factor 9 n=1 Tax=Rhinolophus ferrumequinum TaxID=59479 RepID=A0A7J7XPH1_RHIFE|nr:interferon regulatory factor 9 [Rhinolophus ferrumequinum]
MGLSPIRCIGCCHQEPSLLQQEPRNHHQRDITALCPPTGRRMRVSRRTVYSAPPCCRTPSKPRRWGPMGEQAIQTWRAVAAAAAAAAALSLRKVLTQLRPLSKKIRPPWSGCPLQTQTTRCCSLSSTVDTWWVRPRCRAWTAALWRSPRAPSVAWSRWCFPSPARKSPPSACSASSREVSWWPATPEASLCSACAPSPSPGAHPTPRLVQARICCPAMSVWSFSEPPTSAEQTHHHSPSTAPYTCCAHTLRGPTLSPGSCVAALLPPSRLRKMRLRLGQVLPGPGPPTQVSGDTEFLGGEAWPQPHPTESYHSADGAGLCPTLTGGDSRGPGSHSVPVAKPRGPTFLLSALFLQFSLKETCFPHC